MNSSQPLHTRSCPSSRRSAFVSSPSYSRCQSSPQGALPMSPVTWACLRLYVPVVTITYTSISPMIPNCGEITAFCRSCGLSLHIGCTSSIVGYFLWSVRRLLGYSSIPGSVLGSWLCSRFLGLFLGLFLCLFLDPEVQTLLNILCVWFWILVVSTFCSSLNTLVTLGDLETVWHVPTVGLPIRPIRLLQLSTCFSNNHAYTSCYTIIIFLTCIVFVI